MILAPCEGEARLIASQFAAAGLNADIATSDEVFGAIISGSLGAAIVTQEALESLDLSALAEALAAQPPWSDCPFLFLSSGVAGGWSAARIAELLGNVTILQRPVPVDTLVSVARTATRAQARRRRARQDNAALEETLRESAESYRHAVELSGQIPWTAATNGRLLGVDARWYALTGTTAAETLGSGWHGAVHPDDLDVVAKAWREAIAGGAGFECDYRVRRADGGFVWFRSRAAPRLAADGHCIRWHGTLEDIDERRAATTRLARMQADLVHVSRLSAMGTMASTLAHELNQPLTAVVNYVRGSRRMLAELEGSASVRDALVEADRNAVRAGEIVRRVREFVARGEIQRRPENLSALVREACSLALIDARSAGIRYRLDLDSSLGDVFVDRIQIQQVLINLLRNAIEAMPEGPVRRIVVQTSRAPLGMCTLRVRDTGPGVSEAAGSSLFEPFNTTKGDGMGVGLSISRSIIEAHGGEIWSKPARGGGAEFGFTLALATQLLDGQAVPRIPASI